MTRRTAACGSKRGVSSETTRLIITFPDELFSELRTKAGEEKTSLNEQVLKYIEWGQESEQAANAAAAIDDAVVSMRVAEVSTLAATANRLKNGVSQFALFSEDERIQSRLRWDKLRHSNDPG
jgi:uncharacterized protein (DUF952 family)